MKDILYFNTLQDIKIIDMMRVLKRNVYIIDTTYGDTTTRNTIQFEDNSVLQFTENGLIQNCNIIGNNLTIVPNNDDVAFVNCNFDNATIVKSTIKATNLGLISGMTSEPVGELCFWTHRLEGQDRDIVDIVYYDSSNGRYLSGASSSTPYESCDVDSGVYNTEILVNRRKYDREPGQDDYDYQVNRANWTQIGSLLSRSNKVHFIFNGDFYDDIISSSNTVTISRAENLTISGTVDKKGNIISNGTIMMGLLLSNCKHCVVKGLNWVGNHEKHDFPRFINNSSSLDTDLDLSYDTDFVYQIQDQGSDTRFALNQVFNLNINILTSKSNGWKNYTLSDIGAAGASLSIVSNGICEKCYSDDIQVKQCHIEMRQNGISAGRHTGNRVVRNVKIKDCEAYNIIYQPVGFHASNCTVENFYADSCLQGMDFSERCDNVTVENSVFTNCACGPKQEAEPHLASLTFGNKIKNCIFEINDTKYGFVDTGTATNFILKSAESINEEYGTFEVLNTVFIMNKQRNFNTVINRAYMLSLNNVNFYINKDYYVKVAHDDSESSIGDKSITLGGKRYIIAHDDSNTYSNTQLPLITTFEGIWGWTDANNHCPMTSFTNTEIYLGKNTKIHALFFTGMQEMKQIINVSNVENKGLNVFAGKKDNEPILYSNSIEGNIIINNANNINITSDEE